MQIKDQVLLCPMLNGSICNLIDQSMRLDIRIAKRFICSLNKYVQNYKDHQQKLESKNWAKLFETNDSIKVELEPDLYIYHFKDSELSKMIYKGFEKDEIQFVKNYLKIGDTFFDIGANVGLYSIVAAKIVGNKGKVFAFEPTPTTFSRLLMNVSLNDFSDIVICNNIGLSDKAGTLRMNVSSCGYDAWNTFALSNKGILDTQIDVPVETLESYIRNNNISHDHIALLKIDVEGWEKFVILGAEDLLKKDNAPALIVEFTEENAFIAGTNCYELYDLIVSFGYKWYKYDTINNQLIPEPKKLHYPYLNLIAIKDFAKVPERLLNR